MSDSSGLAGSDQFYRGAVVQGLDWLDQPDRDVVGVDNSREAVGDLGQLPQPTGTIPARRAPPSELRPASQSRTVLGEAPTASAINRSERYLVPVLPDGLAGMRRQYDWSEPAKRSNGSLVLRCSKRKDVILARENS